MGTTLRIQRKSVVLGVTLTRFKAIMGAIISWSMEATREADAAATKDR